MDWIEFGFRDVGEWVDGVPPLQDEHFRKSVARQVCQGPIDEAPDVEVAESLAVLVRDELLARGADESHKLDKTPWNDKHVELELAVSALESVLTRLGIPFAPPPFDFLWTVTGLPRTDEERGEVRGRYGLLIEQVRAVGLARESLAEGVSTDSAMAWPQVDAELAALRQRFESARTPQDYRDVGNRCVATLEALGDAVYDPSKHLRDGEEVPARDKTKLRLERYVDDSLAGKDNQKVRAVVKPVIELAHSVKHREIVTRRDAGIIADSVVLLCNILKRCEQDL